MPRWSGHTQASKSGARPSPRSVQHPLYPPYLSRDELNFDAVWVCGRFGENALHNPIGQFACALIVLLHDFDIAANLYVFTETAVLLFVFHLLFHQLGLWLKYRRLCLIGLKKVTRGE